MRYERLVWWVRGGLPDFEDFDVSTSEAVECAADTIKRLAEQETS